MLQAIELETVIPADGKFPEAFRQFFGRKARVIVLAPESHGREDQEEHEPPALMELGGHESGISDGSSVSFSIAIYSFCFLTIAWPTPSPMEIWPVR